MRDTTLLNQIRESIADEVRAEMDRQGKRQEDLEAATGISQATISYRLRAVSSFRGEELVVIARYLGVPVSQFLGAELVQATS